MSGSAVVQASARVPEEGRPVLLEIAAQMRADPSFIDRAAAWIAAERAGDELADWRAEIEQRLGALEVFQSLQDATDAVGEAIDRISALGGHGTDIGR